MTDQEFTLTMHTLNKYGVPCTDVTEYITRSGGGSGNSIGFYLQKNPATILMFSKMKSIPGTDPEIPDPFEPVTGIPGYVFCVFRNETINSVEKGYCDYFSLGSGALMMTVELPYRVGSGPSAVDIDSDLVLYSPILVDTADGQYEYGRFRRSTKGLFTIEGHVPLSKKYHWPNSVLYIEGESGLVQPRDIPCTDFDPETDRITLAGHGFIDGDNDWIFLQPSGTMPGGLVAVKWYVIVNVVGDTFQLANTPSGFGGWTGEPIDITSQGTGYVTLAVDAGLYFYDQAVLNYDAMGTIPSNIRNNHLYCNRIGGSVNYQTGRLYYEALPDLSSDTGEYKRIALGKDELLVGSLGAGTDYTIQVPMYEYLDENYPNRESYTELIPSFNKDVDDGSGKYINGSGIIIGRYYANALYILLSFDDIRGSSGNQLYQKWYNSGGQFLYELICPSYMDEDNNEVLMETGGRVDHGYYFFHVFSNPLTNESYLRQYSLSSGQYNQTLLQNDKKDLGYYELTNYQLINNKYLMLRHSGDRGYNVFFDAYNPSSGIQGEVVIETTEYPFGYYVIPSVGMDQPAGSPTTNKLLQLCNSVRSIKMTWAVNQVQVCQDHADWCVAHSVMWHEGPILSMDAPAALVYRNQQKGIYAGLAENLTLAFTADEETEQIQAFENWQLSPHHYENILRAGNKYMSFAVATYPESVTQIDCGVGTFVNGGYATEVTIFEVPENLRGKIKLYVQNFIWY